MWRTQCGERILKGVEARVFAESLSTLLDNAIMDQFEDYESDVACFDNLTYGQKISVLATIGNGLFRKDTFGLNGNGKPFFGMKRNSIGLFIYARNPYHDELTRFKR